MKYQKNSYEPQTDIYSPKSFLNNLSPKGQQKKPDEYYNQNNQQNMRNSSSNLKQTQFGSQKSAQFDRTVSMDTFQKNKENFQYGMSTKNYQNQQKIEFPQDQKDSQKNYKSPLQQENVLKNLQNDTKSNSKISSNLQQELTKQSQQFQKSSANLASNSAQTSYKKNQSNHNVFAHRDSHQGYNRDSTYSTRDSQQLQRQSRDDIREQQRSSQILTRESAKDKSKDNSYTQRQELASTLRQQDPKEKRPQSSKNLQQTNYNYKDIYSNIQSSKNQASYQYQNFGALQQQANKYQAKQSDDGKSSIMKKFFENNDKSTISEKSQINMQKDKNNFFEKEEMNTQESEPSIKMDKKNSQVYKSQVQAQEKEKTPQTQSQIFTIGTGMNSPKMQNFFPDKNESVTNDYSQQNLFFNEINNKNQLQKLKKFSRHDNDASLNKNNVSPNQNEKTRNFKEEYTEYKKLQEKLNFLESKIMHIKSNIDTTYQKDKEIKEDAKSLKNSQSIKQVSLKNSQLQNPFDQARNSSIHKTPSNQQEKTQARKESAKQQVQIKPDRTQHVSLEKQQSYSLLQERQSQPQVKQVPQEPATQNQDRSSSQSSQDLINKQQFLQKKSQLQQQKVQPKNDKNDKNQKDQKDKDKKTTDLNAYVTQVPQSQLQAKKGPKVLKESLIQAYSKNSCQISSTPYIYYISSVAYAFMNDDSNYFPSLFREHWQQTIQGISFSKMLKPVSMNLIEEKKIVLNKKENSKKTLVFDLDETLIHCQESTNLPCDVILPIQFPTGEVIEAGINIRPYCMEILQELSKYYEIMVFTASHSCYANVVLDYLDPNHKYIQYRLFRENCIQTEEGVYIKDLRVIQNRSMSNIIIVDNAAYSFGYQIENGLPILPYYDNKNDIELNHLMNYLKSIHHVKDVRDVNRRLLKMAQIADYMDPVSAIQNLYKDLIQ